VLGRSFQGKAAIRVLGESDHMRLLAYAEALPLEPRARLLPEERLEALLLAGATVRSYAKHIMSAGLAGGR
jgi:5-methylcytosine-specific restriction enzyme A